MSVLENGTKVVAVSIMREGSTICTSVYAELPNGLAGESAYLDALLACAEAATEMDCPIIVEAVHDGK